MNNFFLFKDALNVATIEDFEKGIKALNDVVTNKDKSSDTFIRYEGFWCQTCSLGNFYDIPRQLNKEYINLSYKLFDSFVSIPFDIANETEFDTLYTNDCNGFKGFDFSATNILANRQIIDLESFSDFKHNCVSENAFDTIQTFWDSREILFPNLVFCDRVWDQISHLSISDDRFTLINQKLKRLDSFTSLWKTGVFDYKNLGLDNSPDTPTRVKNTQALRTFDCPGIGKKVFSLHIKWSFGREFFRLYYYPHDENCKVYIGYIGPKDDIGF